MTTTTITEPTVHLWTRAEYDQLVRLGVFEGRRIELIEGELIDMPPMYSRHAAGIGLAARALQRIFEDGHHEDDHHLRVQMPFASGERSEPEPDVAVVVGSVRDYVDEHPSSALLVVEVSDSSLAYDRTTKASLYAKAGVPDYWVLNLVDGRLEVHRDPVPDPAARYGWRYASVESLAADGQIAPLARPAARVAVADLLP